MIRNSKLYVACVYFLNSSLWANGEAINKETLIKDPMLSDSQPLDTSDTTKFHSRNISDNNSTSFVSISNPVSSTEEKLSEIENSICNNNDTSIIDSEDLYNLSNNIELNSMQSVEHLNIRSKIKEIKEKILNGIDELYHDPEIHQKVIYRSSNVRYPSNTYKSDELPVVRIPIVKYEHNMI